MEIGTGTNEKQKIGMDGNTDRRRVANPIKDRAFHFHEANQAITSSTIKSKYEGIGALPEMAIELSPLKRLKSLNRGGRR